MVRLGRAATHLLSSTSPSTTTSHPYTTHQRVLGSGNGGLERVGRSRGFGKREGTGKDTGESNQPPLYILAKELPPPPLSYAPPAPPRSPLPKTEVPCVLSAKTEPQWLGFGFWLQLAPPLRLTQSHHPTTSNPVYPTPIWSSLPENEPPHVSFAKTEPQRLGFWPFGSPSPPPRATPNRTLPLSQIQCTPPQPNPLYLRNSPTAFRLPKPSPSGSVLDFGSN